ncbi:MAG: MgtC/SapB family protein [Ktedonobacteraceae bacterium]|nr:MgtC/SapB family protein [Ktedonobacteraceae bacterium]
MTIAFGTALLRLVVALVLGAVIGTERELTEHSAGMRTSALVALGSCLFMIVSAYGFSDLLQFQHIQLDPSRIASYVVAGIGFLGAGTIFMGRTEGKMRGLTTAATVWVVAAIGLVCGVGMLLEATSATVLTLAVLILLRLLERVISPRKVSETRGILLKTSDGREQLIDGVYRIGEQLQITVDGLEIEKQDEGEQVRIICRAPDERQVRQFIDELRMLPGVRSVSFGDL